MRSLLLAATLAGSALVPAARAQTIAPAYPLDVWKDREFVSRFLGNYGQVSEAEPKITDEERTVLTQFQELMAAGKKDEAAMAIKNAIKPDGSGSGILDFTFAQVAVERNALPAAATYYKSAILKYRDFRRAWRALGYVLHQTQDYPGAIKALSTAIRLGDTDPVSYGLYGHALLSGKKPVAAEQAFRMALMFEPDKNDWRTGLIGALVEQSKYTEVVALYDEMIRDQPDNTDFVQRQAMVLVTMDQTARATENLEILARAGKLKGKDLRLLGDVYMRGQQPALAFHAWKRALETEETRDIATALREAELLSAADARIESRDLISTIRSLGGNNLDAPQKEQLLKLESRMALAEGRNDEAARIMEQIVDANPLDGQALMLLGDHYLASGVREKASSFFERASKLSDKDMQSKALQRLGRLLLEEEKFPEALLRFKAANSAKPSAQLQKYIVDLEKHLQRKGK
jgi:tetratricopeptide (TPR) repeat protein